MKIKELFQLLAAYNKLCDATCVKRHYFKIYFDDYWTDHEFTSFSQFMKYLKFEYTKEYCDKFLSMDGQETLDHSHSYSFYVGDEKHTVDVYLY